MVGADGEVYAVAQGQLAIGGLNFGGDPSHVRSVNRREHTEAAAFPRRQPLCFNEREVRDPVGRTPGFGRLAVISSIGTRDYYRGLGFEDGALYQHRAL